jgi:hypothetical protein
MPDDIRLHRFRRRWIVAGTLAMIGTATAAAAQSEAAPAEVWIDLSEPVPAGARDAAEARRRSLCVSEQQDRVAQRLRELGITELARVVHSRNAILVRLTAQQNDSVLAIPGVRRLRPAHSLHPPKPMR